MRQQRPTLIFPLPHNTHLRPKRQCADISIVSCWTQRMIVVGYNGILFQDVGSVTQRWTRLQQKSGGTNVTRVFETMLFESPNLHLQL